MGYSFYIISKEKEISPEDFASVINSLSDFNKWGVMGSHPCDIDFKDKYIRISGSFSLSGRYAEGFVLNILMLLLDLGYKPKVISKDWEYGTEEDFEWLENYTISRI